MSTEERLKEIEKIIKSLQDVRCELSHQMIKLTDQITSLIELRDQIQEAEKNKQLL